MAEVAEICWVDEHEQVDLPIVHELRGSYEGPGMEQYVMTDDKSKKGRQDRSRIDVHERYELDYWSDKFGVSKEELKDAVARVGVMAKDVEKDLKSRP